MIRCAVMSVAFLLLAANLAAAQVKISLDAERYRRFDRIEATLQNQHSQPITICINIGQDSPAGTGFEAAPLPFSVEQRSGQNWVPLLIRDMGNFFSADQVGPKKSLVFPFRLGSTGTMRLRLQYWLGPRPDPDCASQPRARQARDF
jgi:hypothetical protein